MLKIIGSAVVILSATLFGIKKYNTLFERKKALSEILDGARSINSKLSALHAPLHEIFMDSGTFFESASKRILAGQLPEEAVKSTAFQVTSLKKDDIRIIESFASGLCASSCEGQLSNLAVFTGEIEKKLMEASTDLDIKGKLCVKGSILTAAAIVLLLI
ncbi:MAG: stage III sporulation protein AB [Clostridia bacterium]|nr:stage III sporulation protein AB [Clostridia bacterium]